METNNENNNHLIVYYKGKKFNLIEELGALSRIRSSTGHEERLVETKSLKSVEQYEKEFKEKSFGRHDVWIN